MRGRLYAGTSGFSYPAWRGGFYPRDARREDFLRLYAERLPAVELLGTYRRLATEAQFRSWREATPTAFRFSVRLPARIVDGDLGSLAAFLERVGTLGDRLGALVARLPDGRPRDDGLLRFLLGSIDPAVRLALDPRHPTWEAPDVDRMLADAAAVRVGNLDAEAPFRYLRFRDPPYGEQALADIAARLEPLLASGVDVLAFFRHEDDPRCAGYARRLLELSGR